jgi:hypothetical protein
VFDGAAAAFRVNRRTDLMINFYDTSSIKSLVDARRERFYTEVYQRKVALEAKNSREQIGQPHLIRRAVGIGLIHVGAWMSGACIRDMPRLQQGI